MNDRHEHGGFMKHGFLMVLCCLLPIIVIGALPLLGISGSAFPFLIFLLCPLMHIGMMLMMGKSKDTDSCHEDGSNSIWPDDGK